MINITFMGRLPDKECSATCRNCKTAFTFNKTDADLVLDSRDGNYLELRCPLVGCNTRITVAA